MGTAAEILGRFEKQLQSLTLVPSDGGRFEVFVDGELVFSKLQLGRHAEPGEVVRRIETYLQQQAAT